MSELNPELATCFRRQERLCDDLEAVANSLPFHVDRQLCLLLARQIGPILKDAHLTEERLLFPALSSLENGELVGRLRIEHLEDEFFGEEVQYELLQLGQGRSSIDPESSGHMLRGFFRAMRRHMSHELELLRSETLSASEPETT